jgi:F0F1-type ATP synthase delta subunit
MTSSGVIVLCTESFTKEEINLLIAALNNKFGIKATLNKRVLSTGLNGWRIRISKKSMKKVTTIVDPYIIPEFRYKLVACFIKQRKTN